MWEFQPVCPVIIGVAHPDCRNRIDIHLILIWRIGALFNLLLALLHLLHDLLGSAWRSAGREAWADGRGGLSLRLGRFFGFVIVVAAACRTVICGWLRVARAAGAEQDLSRRSLALVPNHHDVVA
jgi:hypothetical protein